MTRLIANWLKNEMGTALVRPDALIRPDFVDFCQKPCPEHGMGSVEGFIQQ
ncbi:MAG: hypothetical protein V4568_09525 [Pseudomonadota bacterium]